MEDNYVLQSLMLPELWFVGFDRLGAPRWSTKQSEAKRYDRSGAYLSADRLALWRKEPVEVVRLT